MLCSFDSHGTGNDVFYAFEQRHGKESRTRVLWRVRKNWSLYMLPLADYKDKYDSKNLLFDLGGETGRMEEETESNN